MLSTRSLKHQFFDQYPLCHLHLKQVFIKTLPIPRWDNKLGCYCCTSYMSQKNLILAKHSQNQNTVGCLSLTCNPVKPHVSSFFRTIVLLIFVIIYSASFVFMYHLWTSEIQDWKYGSFIFLLYIFKFTSTVKIIFDITSVYSFRSWFLVIQKIRSRREEIFLTHFDS